MIKSTMRFFVCVAVVGWLGYTAIDRVIPLKAASNLINPSLADQDVLVDAERGNESVADATLREQKYQNVSLTKATEASTSSTTVSFFSNAKSRTASFFQQGPTQLGLMMLGGLLLGYFVPKLSSKLYSKRKDSKEESRDFHVADVFVRAMEIVEDSKRLSMVSEKFPDFPEALSKLIQSQWDASSSYEPSGTESLANGPSA